LKKIYNIFRHVEIFKKEKINFFIKKNETSFGIFENILLSEIKSSK